jgi:hypothetical protein
LKFSRTKSTHGPSSRWRHSPFVRQYQTPIYPTTWLLEIRCNAPVSPYLGQPTCETLCKENVFQRHKFLQCIFPQHVNPYLNIFSPFPPLDEKQINQPDPSIFLLYWRSFYTFLQRCPACLPSKSSHPKSTSAAQLSSQSSLSTPSHRSRHLLFTHGPAGDTGGTRNSTVDGQLPY